MRSATTITSLVASRSTGPSSPFLGLAAGSGLGAALPLVCSALARRGANTPGRSRVKRSLSSSALMLGIGRLRLVLQVVDRDLGRNANGFLRPFEIDCVVHDREEALQLGMLDLARALLAGQRRAVRAHQRKPAHRVDQ